MSKVGNFTAEDRLVDLFNHSVGLSEEGSAHSCDDAYEEARAHAALIQLGSLPICQSTKLAGESEESTVPR